jgi:hypothetical protein
MQLLHHFLIFWRNLLLKPGGNHGKDSQAIQPSPHSMELLASVYLPMKNSQPFAQLFSVMLLALGLAGCGGQPTEQAGDNSPIIREPAGARRDVEVMRQPSQPETLRNPQAGQGSEQQLQFLHRIREADPQFQTVERAVMNERNELGLILSRNVQMDSIPALMRGMLSQMAKEFPGQDLTIVAYAPANPPVELGKARLYSRSRQMTFSWAQQVRGAR